MLLYNHNGSSPRSMDYKMSIKDYISKEELNSLSPFTERLVDEIDDLQKKVHSLTNGLIAILILIEMVCFWYLLSH